MKLNLKVSHKVYLGFGIIVVLLLISGIASVFNLSDIRQSTLQVKDVAVPVQKQSNQLQINLLKQAKLSTLSFNHKSVEQIQQSRENFSQVTKQLNKDFEALASLVAKDPQIKPMLKEAGESYQVYINVVGQMLNAIEARINANMAITRSHDAIITAMDEAGAFLLELSYLEDSKNQATLEQIAGAANQLDGYLLNVLNTAKETVVADSVAKVEKSKETVAFTISNLDAQIDYLKQLAGNIDTGGIMEQFLSEYAKGVQLLNGDNNLLDLKLRQLQLADSAADHLSSSENAVNRASNFLDELLKAADQQFNRLQQDNLEALDEGSTSAIVIMGILVVLAITSATLTTREMLNPLEGINDILSYMAQGDLTRKLQCRKQDEFGQLSKNINEVVEDLTELINEIHANASQLSSAAIDSSNEMREMSNYVERQKDKVEQVTEITHSMDDSVSEVAHQAQSAAGEMQQALKQSEQVDAIAKDNNERISHLEEQLEETTSVIDRLQVESNNIGGILETIRGIAEQTNLLALNAAIEAARAGEQGRGFAVVADEVRSLAGRTQQSTAEIQTMIENLQSQTQIAVADINKGKEQATLCVKHTDELTQSLSLINNAIVKMHGMSAQIADAANLQSAQSKQITQEVQEVVHLADKNAQKSQSSLAYSSQVGKLADALLSSVNTFKV